MTIGIAALYLSLAFAFRGQINDDAFITFRYARFLATGQGPYFNVGEHVEGYTNFILVLVAAVVFRLGGPEAVLPAIKILSVLAGLVVLIRTAGWVRMVLQARMGSGAEHPAGAAVCWLAAALVACNGSFVLNSTTGLETTIFSAWLMLGIHAMAQAELSGRWRGAGIFFALACLTRPEGALYFAAAMVGQAIGHIVVEKQTVHEFRRRVMIDVWIVALTLGAHGLFRWVVYDGDWLPNTFYAKTGGMPDRTASGYLRGYAAQYWGLHPPFLSILPLLFALAAPWLATASGKFSPSAADGAEPGNRRGTMALLTLPAAAVLTSNVAGVLVTGPDWMPGFRLLAPFVPVWSGLTTASIVAVLMRWCTRVASEDAKREARFSLGPDALRGTVVAMVSLLVYTASVSSSGIVNDIMDCRTRARGYAEGHEALARWLGQQTQPGQAVALMDIGIVGYLNPQLRILDITGLTDRYIARSPGRFLDKRFDPQYVFARKPDYLVIVLNAHLLPDGRDDEAGLKPFSPIEERLVEHPSFKANYHCPREPTPGADELDALAARLGAVKVFRHRYPGMSYLLAAFEYRDDDARPARRDRDDGL